MRRNSRDEWTVFGQPRLPTSVMTAVRVFTHHPGDMSKPAPNRAESESLRNDSQPFPHDRRVSSGIGYRGVTGVPRHLRDLQASSVSLSQIFAPPVQWQFESWKR